MTTGKIIALTRWTFVGKVMSLLFNMLSGFAIAFLPRTKHLLNLWLQSPSTVIVYMHHIFFIHSSVDGLLGYFLVLPIVNSVAMNIEGQASFKIILCPDICPGVGLQDHVVALYFILWGTSLLSEQQIYILHQQCKRVGSLFSAPYSAFIVCIFCNDDHFDWCEVIPQCSFDLPFFNS